MKKNGITFRLKRDHVDGHKVYRLEDDREASTLDYILVFRDIEKNQWVPVGKIAKNITFYELKDRYGLWRDKEQVSKKSFLKRLFKASNFEVDPLHVKPFENFFDRFSGLDGRKIAMAGISVHDSVYGEYAILSLEVLKTG